MIGRPQPKKYTTGEIRSDEIGKTISSILKLTVLNWIIGIVAKEVRIWLVRLTKCKIRFLTGVHTLPVFTFFYPVTETELHAGDI